MQPRCISLQNVSMIGKAEVRDILNAHRGLVEGEKNSDNADPFAIAIAQENNCVVVTEEGHSNSVQAPKIPNNSKFRLQKCNCFMMLTIRSGK